MATRVVIHYSLQISSLYNSRIVTDNREPLIRLTIDYAVVISVTTLDGNFHLLRIFKSLLQFFQGLFIILQNFELPLTTNYAIGQILVVVNGQNWQIHFVIWSHWPPRHRPEWPDTELKSSPNVSKKLPKNVTTVVKH